MKYESKPSGYTLEPEKPKAEQADEIARQVTEYLKNGGMIKKEPLTDRTREQFNRPGSIVVNPEKHARGLKHKAKNRDYDRLAKHICEDEG